MNNLNLNQITYLFINNMLKLICNNLLAFIIFLKNILFNNKIV